MTDGAAFGPPLFTGKGNKMTQSNGPAWFFRAAEGGEIESRIFEDGIMPDGWVDSPAKIEAVEPKPRRGRRSATEEPAQAEETGE
jgi:hypothetical protein